MKKISIIISLMFVLLIGFFFIPLSKATEYNWIENNSFENVSETTAYYELLPNGIGYDNIEWNLNGDAYYIDVFDQSDASSISAMNAGDECSYFTFENLPDSVLEVDNVTLIVSARMTSYGVPNGINFTTLIGSSWVYMAGWYFITSYSNVTQDISSLITSVSLVNTFTLRTVRLGSLGTGFVDAVCIKVGCRIEGTGQDTIDSDSTPWYTYWYEHGNQNYIGITDSESYDGDYSAYLTRAQGINGFIILYQDVNWLLSDNITDLTLYAKTDSATNVQIRYYVWYADGLAGIALSEETLDSGTGWTLINFPLLYVNIGKLVTRIGFEIATGDYGDFTYLDLITLNSTSQPNTESRFSFYTVPSTTKISSAHIIASCEVDYQFYGFWYNGTGNLDDSGTFSVESSKGTITGTISYGSFMFDIVQRGKDMQYKTETFKITLNIDDYGIYKINILVSWNYIPTELTTPIPTGFNDNETSNNLIDWIVTFFVIMLPALLFAGGIYENNKEPDAMHINPVFGIIAGLILSIGIGVYTSLVPLWLLIFMIASVAILIVGMASKKD